MNKICSLLILIFLNSQLLNAQIINGKITDLNTKESLIGVNIISEEGSGTASDIDGEYQLKLTEGNQKITFKYIGYEEITKTFNIAKNEILNLNIALSSTSEELNTIVVSAGRFEQKIEEITVSMEVIKPSLIENKNTTDIQTVMDQIPGVNITDGQANIRGGSGWSFGC